MQAFADAFPDLAKVSLGSARPNELQSAGGANSLSVPQLSSQASIFSSETTRPAATSARPSAIARRFALCSSGLTIGPVFDDLIVGMPHHSKNWPPPHRFRGLMGKPPSPRRGRGLQRQHANSRLLSTVVPVSCWAVSRSGRRKKISITLRDSA